MFLVKYLIENGADMEICNKQGHSSLMIAVYREKVDCVKYLIEKGANVNQVSMKGNDSLLILMLLYSVQKIWFREHRSA